MEEAYQLELRLEQQCGNPTTWKSTPNWSTLMSKGSSSRRNQTSLTDRTWYRMPVTPDKRVQDRDAGKNRPKEYYKCGGCGHFAMVCPTKEQRLALNCQNMTTTADDKVTSDTEEDTKATGPKEIQQGSQLLVCVIRRILTRQKKEEMTGNDWLCNNIFNTQGEYEGRSLNLIIDNESGMNVISQEVVQKLKLPLEKHPQPYRLRWVDDIAILVKHQCLINFSLRKHYVHTIHCDVIHMKACHLLLDHPWLYDRWVKYDSYTKTLICVQW